MVTCTVNKSCKYIVFKDGATYYALNGATGNVDSSNASAHTVIQYAIDNGGDGVVSIQNDIALTAQITLAAGVTLDFNNHTITPSTSFDMFYMKEFSRVENGYADVDGIAFTHAVFLFDGSELFHSYATGVVALTGIRNFKGKSSTQQGKFVYMKCDADNEWVTFVLIENCMTREFEYAYYQEASFDSTNCFCNANIFMNCVGNRDKYHIFQTITGAGKCHANRFENVGVQMQVGSVDGVTIAGDKNIITGQVWDCTGAMIGLRLLATADMNYIVLGNLTSATVVDGGGTHNLLFLPDTGSLNMNSNFELFKGTGANPYFYISGDDGGNERTASLQVDANGIFRIISPTGEKLALRSDTEIHIGDNADCNITCFNTCGTGENRYFNIRGRDAADANTRVLRLRWGDGAIDEGIIETTNGDLFLNPTTNVIKFGVYNVKGAEAFDGFIPVKDRLGNARKIMTCA